MDNFNGSVKPINIDDSIEENPDLNSAPIPSESEISNNTPTPNINYVNEQYNNQNNNNYYNQEEINYIDDIERPIIEHYDEIGLCRTILQYIFIILLYSCFIWGIILQIIYGLSLALIADAVLCSIASIMLFYTLKKRSSAGIKFGAYTLCVAIVGFGVMGVSTFFVNKGIGISVGLLVARTLVLMFCTSLNCNK